MEQTRTTARRRASALALVVSATALIGVGLGQSPAAADHLEVTEVEGSAFGCYGSTTFSFGGQPPPPTIFGPLPTVTLPSDGGAETASSESCRIAVLGGFVSVFSTGPLTVTTEGTLGPEGSVTSTALIDTVNTSGIEAFSATAVSSTCTATEPTAESTGLSGSTTITGGTVDTGDGIVEVPVNPEPNTVIPVDIGFASYNYIFNEQIIDEEAGTITVNAVRMETLTGPLQGEVIAGQVVCGLTADVPPCIPGENGARPGYGHGDVNHRHCGPPGQARKAA